MGTAKNSLISIEKTTTSFKDRCKRAGLKLTHQRLEIYREIASYRDHPSAEMIYHRIRKRMPTISLDTIYRTLANFEAHGLINRVQTTESLAHYEAECEQHHHIICEKCRKITDFEWKALDDASVPAHVKKWGNLKSRRITLQGICSECIKSGR